MRCALVLRLTALTAAAVPTCALAQEAGGPHAVVAADRESPETQFARELTARARDRFDAGDFAGALVEFSRAYEQLEGDPRRAELLNNMAVCHERMFHYDLALELYQRYLREGSPPPADREEVEDVIRGLKGLLGKVYITSNVPAELWLDNRAIGRSPGMIRVPAGTRVIEARAHGYEPSRAELLVVARDTRSLSIELVALPEYRGIDRRYFWTGAALTGVALVTGTGLGLRALSKQHDAEQLAQEELLTLDEQQSVHNLAVAADVAFGAAALFAVGTTVLLFMSDFRSQKRDQHAERVAPRVTGSPVLGASALGLSVSGTW